MTVIAQTITSQLELGLPVRNSNVKRFHNSTFDRKPVKLLSCLTTRNTSGQKFRRETFCVSCGLLCTLLISLKKKKKASNKKAVFIVPLA